MTLLLDALLPQLAPSNPNNWNTVTLPPRFGIFDIVVRMSEPVVERPLADADSIDLLVRSLSAQTVNGPLPLWVQGSGTPESQVVRFAFAVEIPQGAQSFEGNLVLTAKNGVVANAAVKTVELPIKVVEYGLASDLFVFFIATPRDSQPTGRQYCWTSSQVVEWSDVTGPMKPLPGVEVDVNVLRDDISFRGRNRRAATMTDDRGWVAYQHDGTSRNVIALPTDWPLIFTASSAAHVSRAHLVRLAAANVSHNKDAHRISDIRLIPPGVAGARIAQKTVGLDPGHAVVYANTDDLRSQEWFVAHQIAAQVGTILRSRFAFPAANLFMTRTAGFGLINPADMNRNNAPQRGADRFLFDIPNRQVHSRQANVTLVELSNLLLTGSDDRPANITVADRDRLLATNAAAVTAIIARVQQTLPQGQRVQPGSLRWHAPTADYRCRIARHPPPAHGNPIVDDARAVRLATTDLFTLDATMLENLARRSARWSIEREIGHGPGADAATGRPAFRTAARDAMRAHNAEDYMVRKMIEELDLETPQAPGSAAPDGYADQETMGWSITPRVVYLNRKACDISVSVHGNADRGTGSESLVGPTADANEVRTGKLFMKYIDAFNQGTHGGGVKVKAGAGLLSNSTAAKRNRRARHAYLEIEFMDATIRDNPGVRAADPSRYLYQEMVEPGFVDTVAEQIVAAIIEFLIDPQGDIDRVTYDQSLPNW